MEKASRRMAQENEVISVPISHDETKIEAQNLKILKVMNFSSPVFYMK